MTYTNPFLRQLAEARRHLELGWITPKEFELQEAQIQTRLEQQIGSGAVAGHFDIAPGDAEGIAMLAATVREQVVSESTPSEAAAESATKLKVSMAVVGLLVVGLVIAMFAWRSS